MEGQKKSNGAVIGAALIGLGALILLGQVFPRFGGYLVGAGFAAGFAAAGYWFYSQYRQQQSNWGLLIPTYVMGAISGLILVSMFFGSLGGNWGMFIPAYIMFAIAAPFLYVYSRQPSQNWWALIPGGIMGALGVTFLLAGVWQLVPVVLIAAGVFLLWRNRQQQQAQQAQAAAPVMSVNGHVEREAAHKSPIKEMRPIAGSQEDR